MSEVELRTDQGVATLSLAAPERRNALTPNMAADIVAACDAIDADPAVGAVVIEARGAAFCAGAHRETLREIASDPTEDGAYRRLRAIYEAFLRVGRLQPPTVAAVRGPAVGAGVNLVLAADLRIIAEDATLRPGFVGLGYHPGGGHFALLGRIAGREAAAAMGVFDQAIDGRRAVALGLAWEATVADGVEARAHEIARAAAQDPDLARAVVRSLRLELGPPGLPWEAAVEAEMSSQLWSMRRAHSRGT